MKSIIIDPELTPAIHRNLSSIVYGIVKGTLTYE